MLSLQHNALDQLPHVALLVVRSLFAVRTAYVAFLIQNQRGICTDTLL